MSSKQHDYVIDNASGALVRGDINDVLQAIVSLNYGDNEPTTKYPYQWWADTTTDILKIRNSGNTGWINLLTLAGGIDVDAASNFNEDVTLTTTNGNNIIFDKSDNSLEFGDDCLLKLGAGDDLKIKHNAGSFSEINAAAADLQLQRANNVKLSIVTGGISLTGGAGANITTAASSSNTVTLDMSTACHFEIGSGSPVVLSENTTFAAPSNQVVGQSGSIFITQDSTGSRTAAFNSAFKFISGAAPTLTTTASATDRIDYIIKSSGVIHCTVSLDVK